MEIVKTKNVGVSVVIAMRNASAYFDESITSVLTQTHKNFEVIIFDDASTDETEAVVKKYLSDDRLKYIKNNYRKGKAYNLNAGIEMSKYSYVAVFDGDDIMAPERLEKQLNFLENNKSISIVGSFAIVIDKKGNEIDTTKFATRPKDIANTFFYHYPFLQGSTMFRKEIVRAVGGYDNELFIAEDTDFYLRVCFAGFNGANLPEYLLKYRKHDESTSTLFVLNRNLSFKSRLRALRQYQHKARYGMYVYTYVSYALEHLINARQKHFLAESFKRIISVMSN